MEKPPIENPSDDQLKKPKTREEIESFYYQLRLRDLQAFKDRAKEAVIEIRKYDPQYVFLTETSSIPSGYLMKEGLKFAYPEEAPPIFYRIDPAEVRRIMLKGQNIVDGKEKPNEEFVAQKKELEEFFIKRITDHNAKILIYDADWNKGSSPGTILSLLKNPQRYGFSEDIQCNNVKMNLSERSLSGKKEDGYYLNPSYNPNNIPTLDLPLTRDDIIPVPSHVASSSIVKMTEKRYGVGTYNFRGKIISVDELQAVMPREENEGDHTRQLAYIKALKKVGEEIGREILKEKSDT